jgi:hypothetical protein
MYLRVIQFICPVSWHPVSIHTNTIIINSVSYSVEEGNYSIVQLCAAISKLVDGVTFTFNAINRKVIMSSDTLTSLDGSMLLLLGITPAAGFHLQSKHTCDLTGNNAISVNCDYASAFPNIDARELGSTGLLTRIPVAAGIGTIVSYQNSAGRDGLLISDKTLTRCRLQLTDEDRRPLRATQDFDITLQIEFVPSYDTRMRLEVPSRLH